MQGTKCLQGKNVSKETYFFGCKGNITLFSFPKEPSVALTVDAVCFLGQQHNFTSAFFEERFINNAQFDAGFANRLILKDGAVPAI